MVAARPSTRQASSEPALRIPRKRDWRRAWNAVRALYADSSRTDQVFHILDALEGDLGETGFREFADHPEGQRLLVERPILFDHLRDRDALRALPEGTLGRAYLAFMEEADLAAQGLVDAENEAGTTGPELDPDHQWLADRGRDSHDLWHVLTGYGRDEAGEVGLLAFTYANYPNLGILLILIVASLIGPKTPTLLWERYLFQAYRRGRRANLDFAPYEAWLSLPLGEARARAGIVPGDEAHPSTGIVAGSRDGGTGMAFALRS